MNEEYNFVEILVCGFILFVIIISLTFLWRYQTKKYSENFYKYGHQCIAARLTDKELKAMGLLK